MHVVAPETTIEVVGLSKTYPGGVEAVQNVSFNVGPGEVFGLLGPNGAGKSTTIGMLTTTIVPTSGTARLAGVDVTADPLAARRMSAVVFQDAGLFNRSIGDNIAIGRAGATLSDVEAAAKLAEAHDFIMRKPGGYGFVIGERGASLSGGERQRIAIGRALLMRPRLLLLDEPLASLDAGRKQEILPYLLRLRDDAKVPMLYVSHQAAEIARIATQVVRIEEGRIVAQGGLELLGSGDSA